MIMAIQGFKEASETTNLGSIRVEEVAVDVTDRADGVPRGIFQPQFQTPPASFARILADSLDNLKDVCLSIDQCPILAAPRIVAHITTGRPILCEVKSCTDCDELAETSWLTG